jgi:RimJ/RimL family protein N-acetyltransferase
VPHLARVHTESADAAYAGIAAPDPERLQRRHDGWEAVLQDPQFTPLVAEADGEIVGVANVGPARDEPDAGELFTIYVLPSWWGTEVGQRLLERAHGELSGKYAEGVLTVLAANGRARRFYERNGWTLDGVHVEPHFGGHPTEVARYRRRFDATSV